MTHCIPPDAILRDLRWDNPPIRGSCRGRILYTKCGASFEAQCLGCGDTLAVVAPWMDTSHPDCRQDQEFQNPEWVRGMWVCPYDYVKLDETVVHQQPLSATPGYVLRRCPWCGANQVRPTPVPSAP